MPVYEYKSLLREYTKPYQSAGEFLAAEGAEGWLLDFVVVVTVPSQYAVTMAEIFYLRREIANPQISSLNPTSIQIGAADTMLAVLGEGFTENSRIVFDGVEQATTYHGPTHLSMMLHPSAVSDPVQVPVTVRNANVMSNEVLFSFTAA